MSYYYVMYDVKKPKVLSGHFTIRKARQVAKNDALKKRRQVVIVKMVEVYDADGKLQSD